MLQEPNYTKVISLAFSLKEFQVQVVLDLTQEGATVPFIARYRKERTGNLDENQIRDILELQKKEENLYKAKQTAINGITEAGLMTEELMNNILSAKTLKEVEEIYKPYKSKKKTKAMIAIEKGFQVVADAMKQNQLEIPANLLELYPREEIIEGSKDIIGAEVVANSELRHFVIEELQENGCILSKKKSEKMLAKLNEKDQAQIDKFQLYFEFTQKLSALKPYQTLALNRGENLGILTVKLQKDEELVEVTQSKYARILQVSRLILSELVEAFKNGFESLFDSIENELRSDQSEKAEDESILSFQQNLQSLLLTKPEYQKTILAIDPGYRAGCKVVVLDPLGNPLTFTKVFLFETDKAKQILSNLIEKYKIDTIVVGNGTASDEMQALVGEIFSKDIFVVNESGASVYSVSKIAEEEFPHLDSLDRGTVSIGRRFIDPLSELVKVPVGSIGVGMYQHDVSPSKLEEKLGYVVEDAVNQVGIQVNTASVYLLNHISGIDKRQAKKIYLHRPYRSRQELKNVLGDKAYEQAIGFLRVAESEETLDNTDIHPDQYALAWYIINSGKTKPDDQMKALYPEVTDTTVRFIRESYRDLGLEKRTHSAHTKAKKAFSFDSLSVGQVIEGVVRNVVAFGAFVDVGLKNNVLVHISQLSDSFVKNPLDVVQVGESVKVRIVEIDQESKKLSVTMKSK